MRNLFALFAKYHDICKQLTGNLVNKSRNIPHCGVIPKFSNWEAIALSMTAKTESINSENLLFSQPSEYQKKFPNLISHHQFNDRKKFTLPFAKRSVSALQILLMKEKISFALTSNSSKFVVVHGVSGVKLGIERYTLLF
jgi:hypothetical protein